MTTLATKRTITLLTLLIIMCGVFGLSDTARAKVGVGMGAGEIRLNDPIKPGGIYKLPSVRIFNTGDEVTTYTMDVAYHQDRKEMRPQDTWFSFSPNTFTLEPAQSREIAITMTVPVKAEPGEYFAFIESGPVSTAQGAGTSVGVAVATKLFFTMIPANMWQGMMYRVSAFFTTYSPWTWIGLGVLVLVALLFTLKRFFSFNIQLRKK